MQAGARIRGAVGHRMKFIQTSEHYSISLCELYQTFSVYKIFSSLSKLRRNQS